MGGRPEGSFRNEVNYCWQTPVGRNWAGRRLKFFRIEINQYKLEFMKTKEFHEYMHVYIRL